MGRSRRSRRPSRGAGPSAMNDPKAFHAAMRAEPNLDLHRLAFADWLEENGDADRGEFIRSQVRLAQLPEYAPERFDLEERSQDLLAEHRAEWLPRLPKWGSDVEVSFRRGLPEVAAAPGNVWHRHGSRL